ncbi:phosphodiesterase [Kaustia mangrovi]|uniref:Phosphodiesterase n=1 Tax=Kaustia mangrovi TaxID=2593653 RepID=A0A7S8C620_9HYPH|nr:phosphodiesterase [Kaustia mangrovi]QPC44073.1 phosphodiesterase [Kaustia mangrovi]
MTEPLRFAILTDTHFVPEGQTIYGFDPRAMLGHALGFIRDKLPRVDFLIVTGDLTDRAEPEAYRSLAGMLSGLPFPVIAMLGNHDRRAPFRQAFPLAPDTGGFVQTVRVLDQATIIALDTLCEDEPGHHGRLCGVRLDFLEEAMAAAPRDRPVLLFQHHPPLDLSIPPMDAIRMVDAEAELAVFERVGRKPDHMFFGHVHRPISGSWEGIPFHLQRALMHQVAARFDEPGRIRGAVEPPDLGYVSVSRGNVVIHSCPFLYDGPVFDLESPAAAAAASPAELGVHG